MITLEHLQNGALAVICFLLCCIFVMAFRPTPSPRAKTFAELAKEHDEMVRQHRERAEVMTNELTERMADNRVILAGLYEVAATLPVIQQRAELYALIRDDEDALRALRQFGANRRVLPESYDWL